MSVSIEIKADLKQAQKMFKELGPGVERACVRAINKTARAVRAEAAREIQKERNLKISVIKKALELTRATRRTLSAVITATGQPIAIRHFGARQTRHGVTVKIRKQGKRVRLQRNGNKSFIVHKFGGNVFVRTTPARLSMVEWGRVPGLPRVFAKEKISDAMESLATTVFAKRFKEEINYELQKAEEKAGRG